LRGEEDRRHKKKSGRRDSNPRHPAWEAEGCQSNTPEIVGENTETATPAKPCCTPCCTESTERLDELARAVRLVAGMKGLTDDERQAVLDRLLDGDKPKGPTP
jgi:hypothetical protein